MRLLYTVLLGLITPLVLLRLLWKSRQLAGYRGRIGERFGFVPPVAGNGVAVWVHAVSVGEALAELAAFAPRLAQTVECRYFAGYTEAETAEALGVGIATVQRDWAKARAWLYQRLTAADA